MVQIVENWSLVRGRVVAVEAAPDASRPRLSLQLRVEAVDPVSGYPNLLADAVGETITVSGPMPARVPHVGESVRCRLRKAGPRAHFYLADSLVVV